jgi:hypothetical protein
MDFFGMATMQCMAAQRVETGGWQPKSSFRVTPPFTHVYAHIRLTHVHCATIHARIFAFWTPLGLVEVKTRIVKSPPRKPHSSPAVLPVSAVTVVKR